MIKKSVIVCFILILLITLSGCPDKEDKSQKEDADKIPNTLEKASAELEQIITLLGGPVFDSRDRIEQLKNEQMQDLATKRSEKPEQTTTASEKTEQNQESGGSEQQEDEQESSESEKQEKELNQGGEQQGEQKESSEGGEGEKSSQDENSGEQQDVQKPSPPEKAEKPFQFEDSLFGIPQWNDENWKMIKVLTDGLHFTWNNLQPQLLEKGVSPTQNQSFGTDLEDLSKSVRDRSISNAQTAAFELVQSLADFYTYYKTEIPPELQRITSLVTGIHFSVHQNSWEKAQELSGQLLQEYTKIKTSVEDNQSQVMKMLEISLEDLNNAVKNQDSVLVMIRTNLVTANIQELDTQLSQEQK